MESVRFLVSAATKDRLDKLARRCQGEGIEVGAVLVRALEMGLASAENATRERRRQLANEGRGLLIGK